MSRPLPAFPCNKDAEGLMMFVIQSELPLLQGKGALMYPTQTWYVRRIILEYKDGILMTSNQRNKIDNFMVILPARENAIYRDIAEYAVELGYAPLIEKNTHDKIIALVFSKKKLNKRLLKIHPPGIYSNEVEFKMQFYAASEYSDFIHEKLCMDVNAGRAVCKEKNKKCASKYTFSYPDGEKGFRCAIHSLVKLSPLSAEHINEIKELMKIQDEFWIEQSYAK